LGCWE